MNIDRIDWLTSTASRVLDILLMKYPTRTGLGLVLGGFFSFAVQLFAPALRSIKYMDFAGSPWWGWLLLGVLIFHLPTAFSAFRQKPIGNDPIDQAMELIERGNFSPAERRQKFRLLIEEVLHNAALKPEFQQQLKNIEKSLAAEGKTP